MIFGEKVDNSLWLILRLDDTHKDMITTFIQSIPNEFLEEIRFDFRSCCQRLSNNYSQSNSIYKEYKLLDKALYWYEIGFNGFLNVGVKILKNNEYKSLFEMKLKLIDSFDDMENFVPLFVGTIGYYKFNRFSRSCSDFEYINYELLKDPEGYGILWSQSIGNKFMYCQENMDNIPVKLGIYKEKSSCNKLLRTIDKVVY